MTHEPKLTVYIIKLQQAQSKKGYPNNNKWLFRNLIGQANTTPLTDTFIITEVFKKFIAQLDTPSMFSDDVSRKCMTANQKDIESTSVNTNIRFDSDKCIIEGKVEGGGFGRKRNKTSTIDKNQKSSIDEKDAITEDFYFFLYTPLLSSRSILMVQSYSDDSIDSVMKKFLKNFFSCTPQFKHPTISRFVPKSIIEDFKKTAKISSLDFSMEVPSETLLEETTKKIEKRFEIIVQIKPLNGELSFDEFGEAIEPLKKTPITKFLNLGQFVKKKGKLKDLTTNKTSPFELDTEFDIQPTIQLKKYVTINYNEGDFDRIRIYCFSLLEDVKKEAYPQNAIQER